MGCLARCASGVVELGEVSASIEQWLDHRLLRVVNEHLECKKHCEGKRSPKLWLVYPRPGTRM